MMEAVRTSETSVDNQFTRQYNPEDSSEHQVYLHIARKHKNVQVSSVFIRVERFQNFYNLRLI
jgi:hypothetical protein